MTQETLIEFPAEITVKAMGLDTDDFQTRVAQLVFEHIDAEAAQVSTLSSKGGKYLSVSVRFTATSLEQLHAVYGSLKQDPKVLYTL